MTDITNAEWQVMKVLWANGEVTAQFLFDVLGQSFGWQLSTVKTLISRLVKKEYITYTKIKREYHYATALNETDVLFNKLVSELDKLCAKKRGEMLTRLLSYTDFDEKQYLYLFNVLNQKENVYKVIKCNCLQGQCNCKNEKK